jgi:hypothetical protein
MPGLVPGIHVSSSHKGKGVDGRDKPGHDDEYFISPCDYNDPLPNVLQACTVPC